MPLGPTFSFLTPPVPSALGVLRLHGPMDRVLSAGKAPATPAERPRLVTVLDVDHGLMGRSVDGSWWFTPHGGRGIQMALRAALLEAGWQEVAPGPDPDFLAAAGNGHPTAYHAEALRLLPAAPSPAAVRLLLAALAAPVSDAVDPHRFVGDWPLVAPWLSRPRVVICGLPNAGKSTLFNALVDSGQAIVHEEPGTTRDVLTGTWTLLNGGVVELSDTAGLRDASGEAEAAGIALAQQAIRTAHLRIVLQQYNHPRPWLEGIHVATKVDLGPVPHWADAAVSVHRNEGLDGLAQAVMGALFPSLPDRILPLSASMARDAMTPGFQARWFTPLSAHAHRRAADTLRGE